MRSFLSADCVFLDGSTWSIAALLCDMMQRFNSKSGRFDFCISQKYDAAVKGHHWNFTVFSILSAFCVCQYLHLFCPVA